MGFPEMGMGSAGNIATASIRQKAKPQGFSWCPQRDSALHHQDETGKRKETWSGIPTPWEVLLDIFHHSSRQRVMETQLNQILALPFTW